MAYLLKKIRRSKWYKTEETAWLLDGEMQADVLDDLRTKANGTSVFHINQTESNLYRVIAALAVNSGFLSNFDFAIINEEIVSEVGIKIKKTPGDSPDEQVNNWHSDLVELSAQKLLILAMLIKTHARIERISHMKVLDFIADSIISGQINRSDIKWESEEDKNKLNNIIASRS